MIATLVICILVVAAAVVIHDRALVMASRAFPNFRVRPQNAFILIILGIIATHVVEIALFAGAYWLIDTHFEAGVFKGVFGGSAMDYLYFSFTTYTTLGVGDIYVEGPVRLLVGVQSLVGLLLIAWSASFTYLLMENSWTRRDVRRARGSARSGEHANYEGNPLQ
jgi:hypothetical protein